MSSKSSEQLIAEWTHRLKRLGLASTAQALLPVLKPMGGLASQVLWMGQPVVKGLVDEVLWGELALLLEDPDALARLEQQLDFDDTPPT